MRYNEFKTVCMDYLDIHKQYKFYSKYHQNIVNRAIHFICIPLLVFTIGIFGCYTGPLITLPFDNYFISEFNFTALLTIFYSAYYLALNFEAGFVMTLVLIFNQIFTYWLYYFYPQIWIKAIYLHIFSWVMQILGHVYYEKNSPAFMSGAIQSFLVAPLVVLIDSLDHIKIKYEQKYSDKHDKYKNTIRLTKEEIEKINSIKDLIRRKKNNSFAEKETKNYYSAYDNYSKQQLIDDETSGII